MFMKTTEQSISTNAQEKLEDSLKTKELCSNFFGAKSIRPQKSMARIKSCRPQRMKLSKKVVTKRIIVK